MYCAEEAIRAPTVARFHWLKSRPEDRLFTRDRRNSSWYDRPEMANKKQRKKKKKKKQAQASTGKRRRMSMGQIAFVIFAVLLVTSFLVSLIAQGF